MACSVRLCGVALAALLAWLCLANRARADLPFIEWQAPSECGSTEDLRAAVERLVRPETLDATERRFVAGARERSTGRWLLTLQAVSPRGSWTRELEGAACAELRDAAAVLIALALEPRAAAASPVVPDSSGPLPAPPASVPPPPIRPIAPLEDSRSKLVITCDGGFMNGKRIELKKIVDEALARSASVETVIVYRRTGHEVSMEPGRDYWWHDLMGLPAARNANSQKSETADLDAEHPLFLLYTSGTTGQPKAILHTHGGYMVGVGTTLEWVFNVREEDRWWCTADPGWVTGHSYVVYGPLLLGLTSIMYEGAPTYPYPNRWWNLIEKHGITHLYTAPTAIRGLMRFGEAWPNRHDLSSLRMPGSVGEPINPEAWRWYHRVIGGGRCPIMDTWWQTETGMFAITPLPSTPLKPGSATLPFPGIEADVVDEKGQPVKPGEEGYLVLKTPFPAMFRTIYGDPDRYVKQYWERFPGLYFAGDSARKDEDGYFWIIGRVDDVIKVSGYRLGTAEIESALVSHAAVAEAAAIGLPHDVRGHAIHAYVLLRTGQEASDALAEDLKRHVAHELGPIGKPERINFVPSLPKTRSGKIMRRVLKARALGVAEGDLSTLEE